MILNRMRQHWLAVCLLTAMVVLAVGMRYQGWQSRIILNQDDLPYLQAVQAFRQSFTVMDHGDVSSYGSYSPPGTFYFYLFGSLFTDDIRLMALPANLLINLAATLLLYAVLSETLGRGIALGSSLVFAASLLGYQSIWPIGHPVYLLGVLWFLLRWIRGRNDWMFFGAVMVAAFGLYADLAIAPFVLIVPVVWICVRPPVRWWMPILALAACAAIWWPFLSFEAPRGFIDIQSLLLREKVGQLTGTADASPPYCFATLPGETDMRNETFIPFLGTGEAADRIIYPDAGLRQTLLYRACTVLTNLDRNFDGGYFLTPAPKLGAVLFGLFLFGATAAAALAALPLIRRIFPRPSRPDGRKWPAVAGVVGASLLIFLATEPALIRWIQPEMASSNPLALVLLLAHWYIPLLVAAVGLGVIAGSQGPALSPETLLPLLSMILAWAILVALAEPGRPERFWWIWPLQIAAMLFGLQRLARQFAVARWIRAAVIAGLVIAVIPGWFYVAGAEHWRKDGYGGRDHALLAIVDAIGVETQGSGGREAVFIAADFSEESAAGYTHDAILPAWINLLLGTRWSISATPAPASGNGVNIWWIMVSTGDEVAPPPAILPNGQRLVLRSGAYSLYR